MTPHITDALFNLRPGASFQVHGDSYADIIWLDEVQTQPSEQEVLDELTRLLSRHSSTQYQRDRASEYPPIEDYIDGVVKNDQSQIDDYIQKCLVIKAKYPKTA